MPDNRVHTPPGKDWIDHLVAWGTVGAAMGAAAAAYYASRQAETASDTARRQLRAYIEVSLITQRSEGTEINFDPEKPLHFFFSITNRGVTPALDVVGSTGGRFLKLPIGKDVDLSRPKYPDESPSTVFPNGTDPNGMPVSATLDDSRKLLIRQDKDLRLVLYGTVEYRDIFGELHHTNFCKSYYINLLGGAVIQGCNIHNDSD